MVDVLPEHPISKLGLVRMAVHQLGERWVALFDAVPMTLLGFAPGTFTIGGDGADHLANDFEWPQHRISVSGSTSPPSK